MKPLPIFPPRPPPTKMASFRITPEVSAMLDEMAQTHEATKTGIVEQAIRRSYAEWKGGKFR